MLRSDSSRKAHANFQNFFFFVSSVFFPRKIEVHSELNFILVFLYTVLTISMQQTQKIR